MEVGVSGFVVNTSHSMAHGVGSIDVDNLFMLGGAAANQALWFNQPQQLVTTAALPVKRQGIGCYPLNRVLLEHISGSV
jgi:hypothetical protein